MRLPYNFGLKLIPLVVFFLLVFPLNAQQGWSSTPLRSAEFYFASKAFGAAAQYYRLQHNYPSLAYNHNAAEFYTLAAALRLNTAGAEKMFYLC